jgi:hypothetical protein
MELESDKIKISELLNLRRNHILTVNPEYQRGAVWGEAQQKRLVDSVLRGYPLPMIYLHYKKVQVVGHSRDSLEIIDGQQRINALHAFAEGGMKLFDPVKDDKKARFPDFIKNMPCPWAHADYFALSSELRDKFDETELFIVKVITNNDDEARDLFIRLQAGLPLNPQEKRDAWPGGYTEFTLRIGGKREIARYPGHDFFRRVVQTKSTDRGEIRTLCAQVGMLFFNKATEGNWTDTSTQAIDDYYYQNLGFRLNTPEVTRFNKVLDIAFEIFDKYGGAKLRGNEAMHCILLINSLFDDYVKGWDVDFTRAFDQFRHNVAVDKKKRDGEYWYNYGALTMTQASNAFTIQKRHTFFTTKMLEWLKPKRKDEIRGYGVLEREIVYYRDKKRCAVCDMEIKWEDLEIHHIEEHQSGGQTILENAVAVHRQCHPKGQAAKDFAALWTQKQNASAAVAKTNNKVASPEARVGSLFKLEGKNKGVLAFARTTEDNQLCVLKGSTVAPHVSDTFAASSPIPSNKRIKYYREGIINQHHQFTQDVVFRTKSGAASLILGHSANGNVLWVPVPESFLDEGEVS